MIKIKGTQETKKGDTRVRNIVIKQQSIPNYSSSSSSIRAQECYTDMVIRTIMPLLQKSRRRFIIINAANESKPVPPEEAIKITQRFS